MIIIEILIRWTSSIVKWQRWETIFRIFSPAIASTEYSTKAERWWLQKIHDFIIYENSTSQTDHIPFYTFTYGICLALIVHMGAAYCSRLPSIRFNAAATAAAAGSILCSVRVTGGCWITHILINIWTDCYLLLVLLFIHRMPTQWWRLHENYNEKQ